MPSPASAPASTGSVPGRVPLLGHALALRYRPLEFLNSQRDLGDIVTFWLGPVRAYLVNDPALVRELLTTRRNDFTKGGPLFDAGSVLLRNGLVGSDGELHRRQRRLVQPAFHSSRFPGYVTIMQEVAAATAESWQENQVLTMKDEMRDLSVRTVGKCLYSGQISDEVISEIVRSIPAALDGLGRRAALPFRWLHTLPTPQNRRFISAVNRLHRVVDRLVADRKSSGTGDADVVSMLLAARDEQTGEVMPDQQVHDEVMAIVIGGSETTSVAMSWAWHLIATHPDVERKVHRELREVLGGRPVTYADLPRLDYLGRVVTETLRMYPPIWLLPRRAATDTELGGHPISRGSYVFYSPYAGHHDPGVFPDPEHFDPDRWLPERTQQIPRCAHIPFGAGTRQCIGDTFALAQLATTLATISGRWRLRPHPDHPAQAQVFTTLHPGQLRMVVSG